MDRDMVLSGLVFSLCGPTLLIAGLWQFRAMLPASGRSLESILWRWLWTPMALAALPCATLTGWGLQEPGTTDEHLSTKLLVVALPFSLIAARALWRALLSLRAPRIAPAATIGFLRPQIILTPEFTAILSPEERRATWEHEAAHARHRDPLRIWLARFATDLQWPSRAAQQRLRRWSEALEIARDEEARARGVAGEDIASAMLTAARWYQHREPCHCGAALTGHGDALRERVERLLRPVPPECGRRRRMVLAFLGAISVAIVGGLMFGDDLVRALPGVLT